MFVLLFLLWTLAAPAFSQVASGTLLGEVRDESSALVPGARVTARHEATGFSRTMLTGAEGAVTPLSTTASLGFGHLPHLRRPPRVHETELRFRPTKCRPVL